jgi:copper chaperone CopZ
MGAAAVASLSAALAYAGGDKCCKQQNGAAAAVAVVAENKDTKGCEAKTGLVLGFPAKAEEGKTLALAASKLETLPSVSWVKACDEKGAICVAVKPGESLAMSDVVAAVDGTGVSVQKDGVTLGSHVKAKIAGMNCGSCVKGVEGSLAKFKDAKKFDAGVGYANVDLNPGATYAGLAASFENSKFKIEDLVWTAAKECTHGDGCAETTAGCPFTGTAVDLATAKEECSKTKAECEPAKETPKP